ncbi:uncharacterized protein B0I36DRAFT_150646 [Microdochium trichocladiopsis]|uniref:Protein kinase domain-containing protein n=1 Tax=Microdochium trichocladiopsis TaxID=1682393 RepID=A0A9P9BM42_9PEZI|nr:uncharacterized protein B0I36DRAFT_150646 [Microdochium trichocladiopsis]KAH7025900.1 hypothetical protein B0I36DRAFT_150646 [Microdochium trichocladiopsis]
MSNGGTLTLPSPTHGHHHHVDVSAGLRSLRRSLSRSPSKFSLVRTTSQSSSDAGSSPSSPSCRRAQSQYFAHSSQNSAPQSIHGQSPLATPFKPSVKLSLRSAKSASRSPVSASGSKSITRQRASPKSPPRRALHAAMNSGNLNPRSTTPESSPPGQENTNILGARSPVPRKSSDKVANRHSVHLDVTGTSQLAKSRYSDAGVTSNPSVLASPLKRSDAIMSLDQVASGSPKAKRRSYGPSNFAADFNVFDHTPSSPKPESPESSTTEQDWPMAGLFPTMSSMESVFPPTPSAIPRRAGSLRKSTLQQRHSSERTSWGKRQAAQALAQAMAQASNEATSPASKNRPRLSLDHFMPPPARESPFMQMPLPNPSVHPLRDQHQPHPLSRTMTTSSSNSSIGDDSPTHFPIQIAEKPRAPMNWSKSLPIGAVPPRREGKATASISTPDYKHARPFEGAFASTGLISKMNRNPELGPSTGRNGVGAIMPDTPCKKQVSGFATYPPPPPPGSSKGRGRHIRYTFGEPATPFNPLSATKSQHTFGESQRPALFNGFGRQHSRKGSLLSLYSDDGAVGGPGASPLGKSIDNLAALDTDIPPTPTKSQVETDSMSSFCELSNESPTTNRHLPAPVSAIGSGRIWQHDANNNCKLTRSKLPESDVVLDRMHTNLQDGETGRIGGARGVTPSIAVNSSFSQARSKRGSFPKPAPLRTIDLRLPSSFTIAELRTKTSSLKLASPLDRIDFADSVTPHTPQESVVPPDASRLSISNPTEGFFFPPSREKKSIFPPATPTTRHGTFSVPQERRAITPVNGAGSGEVDESLLSRFGKVEYIGKGEFSQVWKVAEFSHTLQPTTVQRGFFSTPTHRTPAGPAPDKVFAVKKLTLPIQGENDRSMRMREVSILKSLKGCDHILQLIDSWEEKSCLYIQTEYCEEGTLDTFLAANGLMGRLDDFRIWKIMLEIGQGLSHIHGQGFIHLDLKPANILINFEGTLKIGDFGLATSLPACKGPDLEGDREYLAPEALRSDIDKPADIFSFGLIMLEIAANVKLPDNGATWTALREGDFSEVPTLTQDASAIVRDATGMPVDELETNNSLATGEPRPSIKRHGYNFRRNSRHTGDIFGLAKKNELQEPPAFMKDPTHSNSLDVVVKSMLAAEPMCRPGISDILGLDAFRWIASRQRASATVFEGNWGPADEIVEPQCLDTEMTDV